MNPIVIYHANCADGFGAAWAVWKEYPHWEFYPGVYGGPVPDIAGREVYLVDFSYKSPILRKMIEIAEHVTILDHHQSAIEDIHSSGLIKEFDNLTCNLDLDRSGAMITWNYFHQGVEAPRLLQHIQDRDLWKFELAGSKEINAALFSYPYDFEVWDNIINSGVDGVNQLWQDGIAILRNHMKIINELLAVTTQEIEISGCSVLVANLPYTMASDAANKLAEDRPFGATYYDTPGGRVFSLRSTEAGEDVARIAERYGGGGHKHASGFTVPWGHRLAPNGTLAF